jgi:hypothetical protein
MYIFGIVDNGGTGSVNGHFTVRITDKESGETRT